MGRRGLAIVAAISLAISACASGATATNTPGSASAPGQAPAANGSTPDITLEPGADATATSGDTGPTSAKIGEAIRITCDGEDCLDVVVLKAQTATRYMDPQGYLNDTPDHKGDVFLAVEIRYTAVGPNADYNEFDWALYINDEQVQNTAYVSNGPKPELSANNLPKGKKVTGWIVWEVPKAGRIVLSYEPGSNGSIFEVVLRSK
jgi:hypothetical protein